MVGTNVFKAPLPDIVLQAIVQGFLTGIVALVFYGRMVAILGATGGAAFLALTPAMTALMGIPILGEIPSAIDWLAVVAISIGVYIVSGTVCITNTTIKHNHADTSNNDLFGVFTTDC